MLPLLPLAARPDALAPLAAPRRLRGGGRHVLPEAVWRPGAEAIVIPCMAVRVGTIAEGLGAACPLPVILANPATLRHAVELAAGT